MLDTVLSTALDVHCFLRETKSCPFRKHIDTTQILHQDSQTSCFATYVSESTEFSKYVSENAVFVNLRLLCVLQFYWSQHTFLPES